MCIKSLEIGRFVSCRAFENYRLLENVIASRHMDEANGMMHQPIHLTNILTDLSHFHLANEIRRCILSEEEIADDASPTLKHIRRSIALTNDKIHSRLTSMINGSYRTYLQDAVVTMRNNRYCIPVKAEHKGQVRGMVHDQSSCSSTFFIEHCCCCPE